LLWIKEFESLRWWVLKVSRAQLHEMPIKLGIITNWLNLEGAKMKERKTEERRRKDEEPLIVGTDIERVNRYQSEWENRTKYV
jgi:hypothetical protein